MKGNWLGTMMQAGLLALGASSAAWLAVGCAKAADPKATLSCGPGTVQQGNQCVKEGSTGGSSTTGTGGSSTGGSSTGGSSTTGGCNDLDPCTQTDTCTAGVCKGANPVVCPGGAACVAGGCPCNDPMGLAMGLSGTIYAPASTSIAAACDGAVLIGDDTLNQLDRYDALSGTMTGSWQLTGSPKDIVYDSATNTAYVAVTAVPALAKVDLGSAMVQPIALSKPAVRLALGNGGTVFALLSDFSVAVVNGPAGTVEGTFAVAVSPFMAFDRVHDRLFLGDTGFSPASFRAYDFDPANGTVMDVPMNLSPWAGDNGQDIAVSPDGKHLAFAVGSGNGFGGYTISDYDTTTLVGNGAWNTGPYPCAVAFSPDSTKILTNTDASGSMKLFSTTTHALLETVPVNGCVLGSRVAVSPGGSLFYTACAGEIVWFVD